ncbi:hypothetical protein V8E51_004403 [Hyaloscypha variabilis]
MLHAPCSLLPAGLGWAGLGLLATRQIIKLPFHVPATAPLAHQTIFRSASPVSPMRDTLCPPVPPVHRLPKRQRSRRDSEQTRQCILVLARMGAETSGEEEAGRGGEEQESCVTASKDSGCGGKVDLDPGFPTPAPLACVRSPARFSTSHGTKTLQRAPGGEKSWRFRYWDGLAYMARAVQKDVDVDVDGDGGIVEQIERDQL